MADMKLNMDWNELVRFALMVVLFGLAGLLAVWLSFLGGGF